MINLTGLGTKTLKPPAGATLITGDILSGQVVECYYDGASMIVTSVLGQTKISQDGREVYALDSSVAANTITVALTPAVTAYVTGEPIIVKVANTVTGTTTINVNGLGAKTVKKYVSGAQANL